MTMNWHLGERSMTAWATRWAAAALLLLGTSATAANYDIVTKFGAPVFSYGTLSAGGGFTAFAHEPHFGRCADHPEWDCFGGPEDYHHVVHTYGNIVPGTILLHAGPVSNVVLRFTAPTSGVYRFDGTSELLAENCNGYPCDGTTTFFHTSTAPATFTFAGDTSTSGRIVPLTATYTLAAGDTFDIVSDKRANYYYDDTLFTGRFSGGAAAAVPVTVFGRRAVTPRPVALAVETGSRCGSIVRSAASHRPPCARA
jgi:hypothetical protein